MNSITLDAPNGTETFNNESGATIYNNGYATITGASPLYFNNSSLITQINGHTGDVITLGGPCGSRGLHGLGQ